MVLQHRGRSQGRKSAPTAGRHPPTLTRSHRPSGTACSSLIAFREVPDGRQQMPSGKGMAAEMTARASTTLGRVVGASSATVDVATVCR